MSWLRRHWRRLTTLIVCAAFLLMLWHQQPIYAILLAFTGARLSRRSPNPTVPEVLERREELRQADADLKTEQVVHKAGEQAGVNWDETESAPSPRRVP